MEGHQWPVRVEQSLQFLQVVSCVLTSQFVLDVELSSVYSDNEVYHDTVDHKVSQNDCDVGVLWSELDNVAEGL